MLQPEKYEANDRNQEIAVKNDAGVSRGEIVRRDHLIDMTAAAPQRKQAGPTMAASRKSKLPPNASNPTTAKPRLAKPTSNWKGLSSHPMKPAASYPKKTCKTKL